MLFTSWQFIFLFLPATVLIVFAIPPQQRALRKCWLILASFFFYAYWKVEYVPLLIVSIVFNYSVAHGIHRFRNHPSSKWILIAGIGFNLLLLGYYKYTNFILDFLGRVSHHSMGRWDIILPLAISFFTFTQIAYLVDVKRDHARHYSFLNYTLFVVFFPHLIAGPIIRHWEIIPQFADRDLKTNRTEMGIGVTLFLLGLYKKLFFADLAGTYSDAVYSISQQGLNVSFFDAWFGTLAFALQIYFDFSGYSDMAIGLARMFGIRFPTNFNSPYKAGSIVDFWSRWHMTLTRFMREYLYFPLGGNRCGPIRGHFNVLTTMLLSGLWHGAGWTFIIWGGLHGFYVWVAHSWRKLVKQRGWILTHWSYRTSCILLTFVLVLFAWVFFRANTVQSAGRMAASMIGMHGLTVPCTSVDSGTGSEVKKARLIQFVPRNTSIKSYRLAVLSMVFLLGVVWFAPNTQQLLGMYEPTFEPVAASSRWTLSLTSFTGFVLGVLFFWVIRTYHEAPLTPFLYFNF